MKQGKAKESSTGRKARGTSIGRKSTPSPIPANGAASLRVKADNSASSNFRTHSLAGKRKLISVRLEQELYAALQRIMKRKRMKNIGEAVETAVREFLAVEVNVNAPGPTPPASIPDDHLGASAS